MQFAGGSPVDCGRRISFLMVTTSVSSIAFVRFGQGERERGKNRELGTRDVGTRRSFVPSLSPPIFSFVLTPLTISKDYK